MYWDTTIKPGDRTTEDSKIKVGFDLKCIFLILGRRNPVIHSEHIRSVLILTLS